MLLTYLLLLCTADMRPAADSDSVLYPPTPRADTTRHDIRPRVAQQYAQKDTTMLMPAVPAPPTYEASQGNPITQVGLQIEDLGRRLDNISQEIDDRLRRLETAQDISKLQWVGLAGGADGAEN